MQREIAGSESRCTGPSIVGPACEAVFKFRLVVSRMKVSLIASESALHVNQSPAAGPARAEWVRPADLAGDGEAGRAAAARSFPRSVTAGLGGGLRSRTGTVYFMPLVRSGRVRLGAVVT